MRITRNSFNTRIIGLTGFLFIACSIVGVISCSSSSKKDKPIAKVKNKYLYFSDIAEIFPEGSTKADSLSLAKLYIDKWIETQLLLQKAELNLSDEHLDISKEIENYRTSLLIYKYEDRLLQEKLDTVVSTHEIERYYNENTANFVTDEYVVKAMFLKIAINAPNIGNVRKWYKSKKEKDIDNLTQYCYKYANKYDLFHDDWVSWTAITKELPQPENATKQLPQQAQIEQSDAGFYYFVSIKEKKAPGDIAPLTIVREKVKNIIINKRKLKFISDLETKIYNDALAKKQFEIYQVD